MGTMEAEITAIKLRVGIRKKLKLLAVLTNRTMMDVVEQLVDEALEKLQHGNSQGVQIQNLSDKDTAG